MYPVNICSRPEPAGLDVSAPMMRDAAPVWHADRFVVLGLLANGLFFDVVQLMGISDRGGKGQSFN